MIIYICICIHVWIHACIHVWVHVCIHVCICVCIRVCIRVFYMYVYMIVYTYVSMYVYMYVYTPLHTSHVLCTYLLTNAFVYIYTWHIAPFLSSPKGSGNWAGIAKCITNFNFMLVDFFSAGTCWIAVFRNMDFFKDFLGPFCRYTWTHTQTHTLHILHIYICTCLHVDSWNVYCQDSAVRSQLLFCCGCLSHYRPGHAHRFVLVSSLHHGHANLLSITFTPGTYTCHAVELLKCHTPPWWQVKFELSSHSTCVWLHTKPSALQMKYDPSIKENCYGSACCLLSFRDTTAFCNLNLFAWLNATILS